MKVLVLTAGYGTGHISAARAVRAALERQVPGAQCMIVDYLQCGGAVPSGTTVAQRCYRLSMEHPWLWHGFFRLTDWSLPVALTHACNLMVQHRRVVRLIDGYTPDVIVTTHPYWHPHLRRYRRERRNIPCMTIVTDSVEIHRMWLDRGVDRYCVIDEETRAVLSRRGIERIVVTGFPVHPDLEQPVDRSRVLADFGLEPGRMTVLVSIGLGAVGRFLQIVDHLRTRSGPYQLILTAGAMDHVTKALRRRTYRVPCAVIGWTPRITELFRSCDLLVGKAGGATVSEALCAGVPMLIPLFVPGQEQGNAYLLEKHGLGFHRPRLRDATRLLDDIISGAVSLDERRTAIARYMRRGAANRIAAIACELAHGRSAPS